MLGWECRTRDLRFKIQDTLYKFPSHLKLRAEYSRQEKSVWLVVVGFVGGGVRANMVTFYEIENSGPGEKGVEQA